MLAALSWAPTSRRPVDSSKAVERGTALGAEAIQIFNQSPRAWRPTAYTEEDYARFREELAASGIRAVLIHAVYLLNCASDDPEIVEKSLAGLIGALRLGDAIGAAAVVLHPGSAKLGPVDARRPAAPGRSSARPSTSPTGVPSTSRTRPAPAGRSADRSTSWPPCSMRPAATTAWASASIRATCSPPAMRYAGRPSSAP